jgi:hypothetical protein
MPIDTRARTHVRPRAVALLRLSAVTTTIAQTASVLSSQRGKAFREPSRNRIIMRSSKGSVWFRDSMSTEYGSIQSTPSGRSTEDDVVLINDLVTFEELALRLEDCP